MSNPDRNGKRSKPDTAHRPAFDMTKPRLIAFHFPHKTASVFAYKILARAARKYRLPLFSPNKRQPNHADLSREGQPTFDGLALRGPVRNFTIGHEEIPNPGVFYRFATPVHVLQQADYRAVCQTRDILDLVVSQYFSHGWIHPPKNGFGEMRRRIQSGDIGIFDYALLEFAGNSGFGQESIIEKYCKLRDFRDAIGPERMLVVRYEEMVTDYDRWAGRISDFLGDWIDFSPVLRKVRPRYRRPGRRDEFFGDPRDYVKQRGRELKHVRSPFPGDHRRFLTAEEISDLKEAVQRIDDGLPSVFSA